jgi:hypothetical protein
MRRRLDQWFDTLNVRPDIIGEFDDSELLWEFGRAGSRLFPVPRRRGVRSRRSVALTPRSTM